MGDVINDAYDTSLSVWIPVGERHFWMDASHTMTDRISGIFINAKTPPVDVTLYFRPFSDSAWVGIFGWLGCAVIVLAALMPVQSSGIVAMPRH